MYILALEKSSSDDKAATSKRHNAYVTITVIYRHST
jgi:hypothetical protein